MQVGYFTERPYRWLPEEEILKNRTFFRDAGFPSIYRLFSSFRDFRGPPYFGHLAGLNN